MADQRETARGLYQGWFSWRRVMRWSHSRLLVYGLQIETTRGLRYGLFFIEACDEMVVQLITG